MITLKTRLTAMMIAVLLAVVGLQFLLLEQERRELVSRLSRLSETVDRSTAKFVARSRSLPADGPPEAIRDFLQEIESDSSVTREPGSFSAQIVVLADSAGGPVLEWKRVTSENDSIPGAKTILVHRVEATAVVTNKASKPGSVAPAWTPAVFRDRTDSLFRRSALPPRGSVEDFVVHLPVPAGGPDSLYSVEVRYGFGHVAEELAASRRRGVLWMTAILGVGVIGAVLVARQFTKPIQTLRTSFGEVTRGNLELQVRPERNDEIGALTDSFNHMVSRLRESRAMEHRLAEAEHLASLGQLAAGVAHEVRNPLNAILLTLQHMRDRSKLSANAFNRDPEMDTYYEMATSEIARLDRMVSAFLDLSKSGELRRAPIDLSESLRASVALFQPVAEERGVVLKSEIEANLMSDADPVRVPMVWNNLIANAIEVGAPVVSVSARRAPKRILIQVSDNGPGISPDLLPRIWEPFVSGRDNGTGLGLSIVRSVVERHGGSVSVESKLGEGTKIRVEFPELDSSSPRLPPATSEPSQGTS